MLGFVLHLLSCLLKNFLIEVNNVLFLLGPQLGTDRHLLIKNLLDIVCSCNVVVFLFPLLCLVEMLAKLLNFAPLVITNIGGEVFNWNLPCAWSLAFN